LIIKGYFQNDTNFDLPISSRHYSWDPDIKPQLLFRDAAGKIRGNRSGNILGKRVPMSDSFGVILRILYRAPRSFVSDVHYALEYHSSVVTGAGLSKKNSSDLVYASTQMYICSLSIFSM
jgi:hypothetical protein